MSRKRRKREPGERKRSNPANQGAGSTTGRRRLPDGFGWGVALGLGAALAVVFAGDLGVLPDFADPEAAALGTASATPSVRSLYLAAAIPSGGFVLVDGKKVDVESGAEGTLVPVPTGAGTLEVRGPRGTMWTTHLDPESGDTLRAVLVGEIVVECGPGAPRGALFLDGAAAGTAPGTLGNVQPGWHHVEIREGEAVLYEDACAIKAGEVFMVSVPRSPQRGRAKLTVRARLLNEGGFREATGYPVRVDGGRVGETPLEITLPGGMHSVRVDAPGRPPRIEVLALEGGTSRYVDAEFGAGEQLVVRVLPPIRASRGAPLAIPVRLLPSQESAPLTRAVLCLIRNKQAAPVEVPLVPSKTDPLLYLAGVPESLTGSKLLVGYASCQDELGRRGESEMFAVELRP